MTARTVHTPLGALRRITDEATLRDLIGGEPAEIVVAKIVDRVTPLTRW